MRDRLLEDSGSSDFGLQLMHLLFVYEGDRGEGLGMGIFWECCHLLGEFRRTH